MHTVRRPPSRSALAADILLRAATLAGLWWLLTGGAADSWVIGVPSTLLALVASLRLSPPPSSRLSPIGALRFLGFFMLGSIKGGLQVALMAVCPRQDVHPTELVVPMRLPPGPGQLLLAAAVSLMPGTLAVGLEGGRLHLHVLDRRLPAESELRATEERIARMMGEVLR